MGVVVHLISVRHAALGETKTKCFSKVFCSVFLSTLSPVCQPLDTFSTMAITGITATTPSTTELEAVTKTLCRIEVEKECETKTKTYTKITGYEDTDCKEVEFKK